MNSQSLFDPGRLETRGVRRWGLENLRARLYPYEHKRRCDLGIVIDVASAPHEARREVEGLLADHLLRALDRSSTLGALCGKPT